ncbi:MAG: glutamate-5-semialdehyde dehydrogenase [Clostridiaceae bacterium]|nr:glutamate-5-semialdehyde dehydrogenase [Clostridiaceae bacterium]
MIVKISQNAQAATSEMRKISTEKKNQILLAVADALVAEKEEIKKANERDIQAGKKNNLSEALIDRLTLNDSRIQGMADSLKVIASFPDPVGEIVEGFNLENGLKVQKVRSPLGVIAIIYESRPNVTIDAAGLCLKSSNVSILRGSSSAIHSNKYLADLFNRIGKPLGLPDDAIQLIEDTKHETLDELIVQDEYIDILIPRGGEGLKEAMQKKATIPIIMTGAGTCQIFVDHNADEEKGIPIILNAKTQRPGTCNTVECLLFHKDKTNYATDVIEALLENDVIIHLSSKLAKSLHLDDEYIKSNQIHLDGDEYFGHEFLTKEILLHQVENVDEAIYYTNKYGTHHSDAILTKDLINAERFLNEVDSAVTYLNASTRFSDGGEFGFGGEIGISTQKLHARGPMGIKQLTSERFVVKGEGQFRK